MTSKSKPDQAQFVFVFVDVHPYVLAFGAIGKNFYFELEVDPDTLATSGMFLPNVYYK